VERKIELTGILAGARGGKGAEETVISELCKVLAIVEQYYSKVAIDAGKIHGVLIVKNRPQGDIQVWI
jgi:hypothetical protein